MNSRSITFALAAATTATLICNPAFAGTQKHASATEAYAMAVDMYAAPKGVYTVVGWDGRVAGADLDRNIRFQLMRDAFANEN